MSMHELLQSEQGPQVSRNLCAKLILIIEFYHQIAIAQKHDLWEFEQFE